MRRLLPTLVALALGLGALGWGLAALGRIFAAERADALAATAAERRLLERSAREALSRRLAARLREAGPQARAALADPLVPDAGLLLVINGERRLPRAPHGPAAPAGEPLALYTLLADPRRQPATGDAPWAERLVLRRRLLDAPDGDAFAAAFRDLLAHRLRYVIDPALDVPYQVALLEAVGPRLDPPLLRGLVRDGVPARDGAALPGLQRDLLRHRGRFAAPDLAALGARVASLSRAAGVPSDDFTARLGEAPAPVPDPAQTPALADGWYVERDAGADTRGVLVDAAAELTAAGDDLRALGLLGPADAVRAERLAGAPDAWRVAVDSPRWAAAEAVADDRFRLKSALLWTCGALGAAIAALGVAFQRRRQRHLEMQSEFVATVSHELRTPLASIRLLAETLGRRLRDVPRAGDYPQRIVRDVEGLGFLVENILSFNRLDRGRWRPRKQPVHLAEVLDAVREDVEAHAPRPLRWTAEGLDGLEADADPDLLRLLFLNLARNACQHNTRDPIEIAVEAGLDRGGCVVRLRDNGVGIPERERRRVFAAFHRASAGSRGAGLGLAIGRRVAAAHGGTLRIACSGPEGTTFELRLPAATLRAARDGGLRAVSS